MKTILSVALVLVVGGVVTAADDKKVDPVGTWKCEYKIGDQKRESTLIIKKDGDKITGTMNWTDQKDEKLKDVKLKGDTLTFSAVRKLMGTDIPLEYKFTINGDKLKGSGAATMNGQKTEFDITGAQGEEGEVNKRGRDRGSGIGVQIGPKRPSTRLRPRGRRRRHADSLASVVIRRRGHFADY